MEWVKKKISAVFFGRIGSSFIGFHRPRTSADSNRPRRHSEISLATSLASQNGSEGSAHPPVFLFKGFSCFSGICNSLRVSYTNSRMPRSCSGPSLPKIILCANFKIIVLSRYLELSERSRYRNIAKTCFLSITLLKTTFSERKIKKIHERPPWIFYSSTLLIYEHQF